MSFYQGYRLCRSCHGDWFSAVKTMSSFSVCHSFWTLPWCLCTWGPPSRAAVHSSGPFSSASHSRAVTALLAPRWNGCFLLRGTKLNRANLSPRSRRTLGGGKVPWHREDETERWSCGRWLSITAQFQINMASTWLRQVLFGIQFPF